MHKKRWSVVEKNLLYFQYENECIQELWGKFIHPSKSNAFYLYADERLNKTKRKKNTGIQ